MTKFFRFFIDRPFLVRLISLAILLAGIVATLNLKRDLHPPFEFPVINVATSLPGATPDEMERFVTFPLEEALRGISGLKSIRSTTTPGATELNLTFSFETTDMDEAVREVQRRSDGIKGQLPPEIKNIAVNQARTETIFLLYLAILGFDDTQPEHRAVYRQLREKILAEPGIVLMDSSIRSRDVYLDLNPEKLAHYEISVDEIKRAVQGFLQFAPVGDTLIEGQRIAFEVTTPRLSPQALAKWPIRSSKTGRTLLLGDIATIHLDQGQRREITLVNGHPALSIWVSKDLEADALVTKRKALQVIEDFNRDLKKNPLTSVAHLEVVDILNSPQFIEQQLSVLSQNALWGLALVLLILVLFLNLRTALAVTMTLVLAYLGSAAGLYWLDLDIDLLSLVGIILVSGMLVDNGIVIAEGYFQKLALGLSRTEAAASAARAMVIPVSGSVLTTVIAFLPLLVLKNEMAIVFRAIPVVVISSLLLSWIISFLLLPSYLARRVSTDQQPWQVRVNQLLVRRYQSLIRQIIRWRYLVVPFAFALAAVLIAFIAKQVHTDFNLRINAERLNVYAIVRGSESLEQTLDIVAPIQKALTELPKSEVENVVTQVGSVWMDGQLREGHQYARISGYLNRQAPFPSELKAQIKPKVDQILAGMNPERFEKLFVEIARDASELTSDKLLPVHLKSADNADRDQVVKAITRAALALQEIADIVKNANESRAAWMFTPSPSALARYGISVQTLAENLRFLSGPFEIGSARAEGEQTRVQLRYPELTTLSQQALVSHTVLTPDGLPVPLRELGVWQKTVRPNQIRHLNGVRDEVLQFRLVRPEKDRDMAARKLTAALNPVHKKFPNWQIEVEEKTEREESAQAWAGEVVIFCLAGVLFVLALALGSFSQPLLVALPIPFGLAGIFLALYVHDLPLGLMAIIGLVGVLGTAVNSSIVMMDHINQLEKAGIPNSADAIIKGSADRLRPIVVTTLTTLAGVFPMAYGWGGESGYTQPLAFSFAWGLAAATAFTLLVFPASIMMRQDFLRLSERLMGRLTKKTARQSRPKAPVERESSMASGPPEMRS